MPQNLNRLTTHSNHNANRVAAEDRPAHDWYRFVLSFPPHLVRKYLARFELGSNSVMLDPFCGTGTTLVECKKLGIPSVGIEANPVAHFASQVKTDWSIDPSELMRIANDIADAVTTQLRTDGILDDAVFYNLQNPERLKQVSLRKLDPHLDKLLLANSVSPLPMHKVLVLREHLERYHESVYYKHLLLAFANAVTFSISNLQFRPEVGVGQPKQDVPVVATWLDHVQQIASDLRHLIASAVTSAVVHFGDARNLKGILAPHSIDAVFTSPPYPNEKDYTRTTRLESVLLGFANNKSELQAVKRTLLRSNTRGVYKEDDDDRWVSQFPEINHLAETIEARRIELGKTSGFERLYAKVTKLYFGGMARHLADLRPSLKTGAQLGYVVGDQASYLRVLIRTGEILATIADSLGYEVVGIDLFRTRIATATKAQLREEVLLLRWRG